MRLVVETGKFSVFLQVVTSTGKDKEVSNTFWKSVCAEVDDSSERNIYKDEIK